MSPLPVDSAQAKRLARAELATRVLIVTVIVAVVVIVVLLGKIRTTQLEGTPLGKKLLASSDAVLDCTNAGGAGKPSGDCYKRGQKQTAEVLASVQRIILFSAACAVDLDPRAPVANRIADVTQCVTDRLSDSAKP